MLELLQRLWHNHLLYLDLRSEFNDPNLLDSAEIAIILSANEDNFERYLHLNEFVQILKKTRLRADIFSIQLAQIQSLNAVQMGFVAKNDLLKALKLLHKISNQELVVDFIEKMQNFKPDKKNKFFSNCNELNVINEKMQELSDDEEITSKLKNALEKFNQQSFTIAVTGVMNSGKSSVLNALLKTQILGTSNIPETANLTLLRYGKDNKAKLYFWDKKEWQNIVKNIKDDEKMNLTLQQMQEKYKLDEYIKEENLSKEIKLSELCEYSSAQNPLSLLIKQIELYATLEFLKANITIVDTPGLDDIFIQRELVTNNFIKESDFLIHLMSCTQSLTQKDSEFILSCLLDSRITKFLILISKADLLSQEELNEVIDYTKNTLKKRLNERNFDENFVEKIDFLTVSAQKANEFYEKKAGQDILEESRIVELENYLYEQLFSGQKSKFILAAYKKELLLLGKELILRYETQNSAFQSQSNISNKENESLLNESKQEEERLVQAQKDIDKFIIQLENENVLPSNILQLLAKKLEERIFDELKYSFEKKIKLDKIRLINIFDRSFKDEITDILRDLNHQSLKKFDFLKENLGAKYEFLRENLQNDIEEFKNKLSTHLNFFFDDEKYELLKLELGQILDEKKELNILREKIKETMNLYFENLSFDELAKKLDINGDFIAFLKDKLERYENLQKNKLKYLQKMLSNTDSASINANELLQINTQKIEALKALQMDLNNAN